MFDDAKPHVEVFLDVCLIGFDTYWERKAYTVSYNYQATTSMSITQLEMFNVLIALKIFEDTWHDKKIKIC